MLFFQSKNIRQGSKQVIIPFRHGKDGYRAFWKMIAFLYKWRSLIDIEMFEDYFVLTDKSLENILPELAQIKNKKLVLESLKKLSLKSLQNISNLIGIAKIENIIDTWNKHKNDYDEEFWQKFFQNHAWILSQIFAAPYLKVGEKFYCGGKEDSNRGGVLGDFQYKNRLTGNIAFIEIKTPKRDILIGKKYRGEGGKENIIFSMHEELTGGVNQVLNQKKVYLKTHGEKNKKTLNNAKCVLIIGVLPTDPDQQKSFELYRSSLKDVEVITYDELFDRVNRILNIFDIGISS